MKPETRLKKKQELYEDMNKWLEEHDNVFPKSFVCKNGKRLTQNEMTEEQRLAVRLASRWETYFGEDFEMFSGFMQSEIENIPEQYRRIVMALKLKEMPAVSINKNEAKEKMREKRKITKAVTWLKQNRGKLPRIQKSPITTQEEKEEYAAYRILKNPIFKEIQEKFEFAPLEEIPPEYREYIELYRAVSKKSSMFEEIVDWLDKHNSNIPRSIIIKNGKRLNRPELNEEELHEVRFHQRWIKSEAKRILDEYTDKSVEEIPPKYREYIEKMREHGYGLKEGNCFEEIVEWLRTHLDSLPSISDGIKNDKNKRYEFRLRKRWEISEEKLMLEKYIGVSLEEIPEEYREKIATLRESGLGLSSKDIENKLFEWLKIHNGTLPRQDVRKNGIIQKRGELSLEEYREVRLRDEWQKSEIRAMLAKYAGKSIEEVPEEYREKIEILRNYGLERQQIEYGDVFVEIVDWLKSHEGFFPRTVIMNDDKKTVKKAKSMTSEEQYEISLSQRWFRAEIRKKFIEFTGKPLEDIPEEYRNKIAELRENVSSVPKKRAPKNPLFFKQFIEWLDSHNNKIPKTRIYSNGRKLRDEELSQEQLYEVKLYRQWERSEERKILNEFVERTIEDIPEEFREKIKTLRAHGIMGKKSDKKITDKMRSTIFTQVGNNDLIRSELESEIIQNKTITPEDEIKE